jgi:hypothetical protein
MQREIERKSRERLREREREGGRERKRAEGERSVFCARGPTSIHRASTLPSLIPRALVAWVVSVTVFHFSPQYNIQGCAHQKDVNTCS